MEMVGTIVHQLTRNLTEEQIKEAGFEPYFVDHTTGVFPQFASGYPWSASTMQVTGDTIADLTEDLAAEQKARVTYDNILRLSDDPDVSDVIKFLRAREIVHFQRPAPRQGPPGREKCLLRKPELRQVRMTGKSTSFGVLFPFDFPILTLRRKCGIIALPFGKTTLTGGEPDSFYRSDSEDAFRATRRGKTKTQPCCVVICCFHPFC